MIPTVSLESFQLGPLTIQVWGLFVALGILAATLWTVHRARRRGIPANTILDAAFWIVLAGIVGARAAFLHESPQILREGFFASFRVQDGGMAATGGVVGGLLGGIVFARRRRLSLITLGDVAAPALLLGEGIGRIGCFLIHDHPGRPTESVLGVSLNGTPRHDLGLELSLAAFLGVLVMLVWERYRRHDRPGTLALGALSWYGATRFLLDALRATDLPVVDTRYAGLTLAQIAGFLGVIAAVVLWRRLQKQGVTSPADT